MRLWSLHPGYLDSKGLVALWRAGLLAKAVLNRQTGGYQNHPQLERFQAREHPVRAIEGYLWCVYREARRRGYRFDAAKLGAKQLCSRIPVTEGQLRYELAHLLAKLRRRDPAQYRAVIRIDKPKPHPLFKVVAGGIESWERVR